MKLKAVSGVKTQAEARQIAIDWQLWQSEQNLSYTEAGKYQTYFEKLAEKFNLQEEFTENAII